MVAIRWIERDGLSYGFLRQGQIPCLPRDLCKPDERPFLIGVVFVERFDELWRSPGIHPQELGIVGIVARITREHVVGVENGFLIPAGGVEGIQEKNPERGLAAGGSFKQIEEVRRHLHRVCLELTDGRIEVSRPIQAVEGGQVGGEI